MSKREMTVLKNHMECYRHRVCNAVFSCEVCQSWSEKKRAVVNKMIERKKSEAARKSATVTSLATEIPSVGKQNRVANFTLGRKTKWRQYDTEHFSTASWLCTTF